MHDFVVLLRLRECMSISAWRNRKEFLWSGYYPGRAEALAAKKEEIVPMPVVPIEVVVKILILLMQMQSKQTRYETTY